MQSGKEPGFPARLVNNNIQHLMYSHVCSLMTSEIKMSVSLLLPELLWPMTTYFQTSVNMFLIVIKITDLYMIIFTVIISSILELSEEL